MNVDPKPMGWVSPVSPFTGAQMQTEKKDTKTLPKNVERPPPPSQNPEAPPNTKNGSGNLAQLAYKPKAVKLLGTDVADKTRTDNIFQQSVKKLGNAFNNASQLAGNVKFTIRGKTVETQAKVPAEEIFQKTAPKIPIEDIRETLLADVENTQLGAPFRGEGEKGLEMLTAGWRAAVDSSQIGKDIDQLLSNIQPGQTKENVQKLIQLLIDNIGKTTDEMQNVRELALVMRDASNAIKERQGPDYNGTSKIDNPTGFATATFALRVITPKLTAKGVQTPDVQDKIGKLTKERDEVMAKLQNSKKPKEKETLQTRANAINLEIQELGAPFKAAVIIGAQFQKICNELINNGKVDPLFQGLLTQLGETLTKK